VNEQYLVLGGSLALGVIIWFLVGRLLAGFGGWTRLARSYTHLGRLPKPTERFQSALFGRWVGYNNALSFSVGPRGLGIALTFPFVPAHPRLMVPWGDISAVEEERRFGRLVVLRFLRAPKVTVGLPKPLAERLREAASGYWPAG
jgi:hypothetical protein